MAATCTMAAQLQKGSTAFAAKPRSSRSSALKRMVVRAEETKLAKVERVAKSGGAIYVNTTDANALAYLDGSRPGDFGFDPLGLVDPTTGSGGFISPEWLTYSEVIHCRYAMLGAAGCLAPEVLQYAGVIPSSLEEATWFKNGAFPFLGTYEKGYWADPYTLFWVEIIAMQFAELRRWQDFKKPGSMGDQYFLGLEAVFKGSGNPSYPGGQFFNAFNMGKTEADMFKLKTNEIRNGRLAMLAMLGFGAQAVMTGKGPFTNLLEHLSDPTGHNLLTNFSSIYGQ